MTCAGCRRAMSNTSWLLGAAVCREHMQTALLEMQGLASACRRMNKMWAVRDSGGLAVATLVTALLLLC